MNIAIVGLTPTQLAARERHLNFRKSIAEKAEALKKSKMETAVDEMLTAFKEEAKAVEPEAVPAETDPPKPIVNWFVPTDQEGKPIERKHPRIEDIQRAVAKHFGVTRNDLCSQRRTADIITPRFIAYYLCKELTPLSLPAISRRFGGRDHTSALHGIKKIKRLRLEDEETESVVARLIEQIKGPQQ